MRGPKGFTLLELLLSTVLSLILLGALSAFLVSTHDFFKRQMLVVDFQERLRYAFYVLGRDIENAGFLGCTNAITKIIGTSPKSFEFFFSQQKPFEISPQGELRLVYANGDKLIHHYDTIQTKNLPYLKGAKFLVATNCEKTLIFNNARGKNARGKLVEFLKADLQSLPEEGTPKKLALPVIQVAPMVFVRYHLYPPPKKSENKKASDNNSQGLYREESGDNQELIPDVVSFQVKRTQNTITVMLKFKVGDIEIPHERIFYLANNNDGLNS